jgi:hypothetical protein
VAVFAVITAKGPNWLVDCGIREQPAWDEHAQFFDGLVERAIVVLGGPISSNSDDEVALLAVEAADEKELQSIFDEDPWARSGVLRVKEVRVWTLWLDGR